MYQTIYIIIFVCLVATCGAKPQNKDTTTQLKIALEYANKGYSDFIRQIEYPSSIISQFPDSIKEVPIRLSFNAKNNSIYTCALLYQHFADTVQLKKEAYKYEKEAISMYQVSDENFFVQGYHNSRARIEAGITPTPMFESKDYDVTPIYSSKTKNGLSEDFLVYILRAESIYNNGHSDIIKSLKGRIYTSGYTQGVALSIEKQTIIYWTMVF